MFLLKRNDQLRGAEFSERSTLDEEEGEKQEQEDARS